MFVTCNLLFLGLYLLHFKSKGQVKYFFSDIVPIKTEDLVLGAHFMIRMLAHILNKCLKG